MIRIVACLIAVWTLFGAPALCQAGVLLHGCHDSICSHETSCDMDPCSGTILKETPLAKSLVSPLLASTSILVDFQADLEPRNPSSIASTPLRLDLDRSLPLLI
jgi:hypothetical protein